MATTPSPYPTPIVREDGRCLRRKICKSAAPRPTVARAVSKMAMKEKALTTGEYLDYGKDVRIVRGDVWSRCALLVIIREKKLSDDGLM